MRASLIAALAVSTVASAAPSAKDLEFFESKIRPVLVKNCHACHTQTKLGGLRLDSREALLAGGKSGPAIVAGNPTASLLMQAVNHTHLRLKMPPVGKLAQPEIDALAEWIQSGAAWPETKVAVASGKYVITEAQRQFWAFQPVNKTMAASSIDEFLKAGWRAQNLTPVAPAEKRVLIRRVTFDLIGLPPAPEEVDAFLNDTAANAYEKVVDRLLASPRFGERWARHWLDLARYADGALGASVDTPYANAFRYRDWVIDAFNRDLPYDTFVKAQIAADLMPDGERHLPALGFQALGGGVDDQLDVTTRTFLGLTVGCAQCHDHKYDPIPTNDYYSLAGVFSSSARNEFPLAPEATVKAYKEHQKKIEDAKFELDYFVKLRSGELSDMMVGKSARYLAAAWRTMRGESAGDDKLDKEVLDRWIDLLKRPNKDHEFLKPFEDLIARKAPAEEAAKWMAEFQVFVSDVFRRRAEMEERNYVKLGGIKGIRDEATRQYTNLESLPILQYYLWRDLASDPYKRDFFDFKGGVYYFGEKNIDRWLGTEWKDHLDRLRAHHTALKESLPKQYPFIHSMKDSDKPKNARVAIRGDAQNLGDEVPRQFLRILSKGDPAPFTKGSGRLELAEVIASPSNPLTARVIANRLWHWHFGSGIVRSVSNFGQLGERPTHPELLDYLAAKLVESGWSLKALHREIVLSEAYRLSTAHNESNYAKDPGNSYHWRANLVQRLDAEAVRDSLLAVAGTMDGKAGGEPGPFADDFHRRAVYGYVGRTKPDLMLTLFDFPNPNNTAEQRVVTSGPMQRLFFLNNPFVAAQAKALADRLGKSAAADEDRIRLAYRLLYARTPKPAEVQMGLDFLARSGSWPQYAQVLLSSSEFTSVN